MQKIVNFLNQKLSYLLAFLILFIINYNILDNLPFGDDFNHIFYHSFLRESETPFTFLSPLHPFFKSWGFSYSILWIMYNLFGNQYVYYRFLNLTIHFLNFLLFKKLLHLKSDNKKIHLISYLFLFTPLAVLTTGWIFQIKTLLATLFIILLLIITNKKEWNTKISILAPILFYFGIISKSVGILLPFYFLIKHYKSIKKPSYSIPIVSMFTISLVYGVINIKGITYLAREIKNLNKPVVAINIDHIIQKKQLDDLNETYSPEKRDTNLIIFKEITHSVPTYFEPLFNLSTLSDKYIIALQNFSKLFFSTIGAYIYFPFYENNLITAKDPIIFFHVATSTFLIMGFLFFKKIKDLTLVIFLFLPISGLFYIPYMKYSYSSDHWFYPVSFAVLLLLTKTFKNHKAWIILSVLIVSQYTITSIRYYNFQALMTQNFNFNKNRFAVEHLANGKYVYSINSKYTEIYDNLLSNKDFNNISYYGQLIMHAKKEFKAGLIRKHFTRFAADQIRSEDLDSFHSFLSLHTNVFSQEALRAIYLLGTIKEPSELKSNYVEIKRHIKLIHENN